MEGAGHDRIKVHGFQTDDLIVELIGSNCRTVDFRLEIAGKTVCSMPLLRDRERLLSAGNRRDRRPDLDSIEKEMHGLLNAAGGHIRKADRSGIGCGVIKGRGQCQHNHRDGEIQRPVVSVDIRHIDLHHRRSGRQVRSHIHCHIALLHIDHGLHHTANRHFHGAVAGRDIVFFRSPVNGDREGVSLCNGPGKEPGFIGQGDVGIVAGGPATAATGSGERPQRTDDYIAIGGHVKEAVLDVSIIHFSLRQQIQTSNRPVKVIHGIGSLC